MKTHLLFAQDELDWAAGLPHQAEIVANDLGLSTVLAAMAAGDAVVEKTCRHLLLAATGKADADVVAHRQAAVQDALAQADAVRALYAQAVTALDSRKQHMFGLSMLGRYPGSTLHGAAALLQTLLDHLQALRQQAQAVAPQFHSAAFTALFSDLIAATDEAFVTEARQHLKTVRFRHGVLLSAGLGPGNAGSAYVLHADDAESSGLLARLLHRAPAQASFKLDEHDEAGARELGVLVDRGIDEVAHALAQAAEHVQGYLERLRDALAFYVGCINLHRHLQDLGVPTCLPQFTTTTQPLMLSLTGLRDPVLALASAQAPVANDLAADGHGLLGITGANQGGKSTLLRALGLAQVMLHAGLFVAAEHCTGTLASGVFTHYKREEDRALRGGKLDEELLRISAIAEHIRPGAVWLSNESFSSTNEREGSQLLVDVVQALRQRTIRVWLVTHLYTAARQLAVRDDALFLRAGRSDDGARSFRLQPGAPLPTSYGADLYAAVFADSGQIQNPTPSASSSTSKA